MFNGEKASKSGIDNKMLMNLRKEERRNEYLTGEVSGPDFNLAIILNK